MEGRKCMDVWQVVEEGSYDGRLLVRRSPHSLVCVVGLRRCCLFGRSGKCSEAGVCETKGHKHDVDVCVDE